MPIKNYNIAPGATKTGYTYKSINKSMNNKMIVPAQLNHMTINIQNNTTNHFIRKNDNFKYYSDTESEPE